MRNYQQLVNEILELTENIHKTRVTELFERIEDAIRSAILMGQTYLSIDIDKKDMPRYIRLYIIHTIREAGWDFSIDKEDAHTMSIRFYVGDNK